MDYQTVDSTEPNHKIHSKPDHVFTNNDQGIAELGYDQDIATALAEALPARFHSEIPVLAQVLTAAQSGAPASVATKNLQDALNSLQGRTLTSQSGSITVGNVTGDGIAIGHGAQATVIRIYIPQTDEQKQAWRNRSNMLEKVRTYWIDGFLNQSLHKIALIELGMQYYPDALEHPWDMFVQSPDRPRTPVLPGTSVAGIFDEFGGELLILGSPGTGKTTMLLELTRTLIERAQQDETCTISVVFNLSSWSQKRSLLADWLVEELNVRYDVPRKLAKAWINRDLILPLLDGLDEVQQAHRNTCVDAINTFRSNHGMVGCVVCSRVANYEVLTNKLRLKGAILLQPLTEQQIDDALRHMGDKAETIRKVLRRLQDNASQHSDQDIHELMYSPLIVSIAALTYGESADSSLPPLDLPPVEQQRYLFTVYVDRMFKRRGQGTKYTPQQTKYYLNRLARGMIEDGLTIFRIEHMQAPWAKWWQWQRWLFLLLVVAITSIIGGLLHFIFSGGGLVFGVFNGGVSWLPHIETLFFGVFLSSIYPIFYLFFPQRMIIKTVETISWSPRKVLSLFKDGLKDVFTKKFTFGACLMLAVPAILTLWEDLSGSYDFLVILMSLFNVIILAVISLFFMVIFISVSLFVIALFNFAGYTLPTTTYPNQGVWHSVVNALFAWVITIILFLILQIMFELWIFGMSFGGVSLMLWLWSVLYLGWLLGALPAFMLGGFAGIQHLSLRITLILSRNIPLGYVYFLDYAATRIFLRKVGGGYIFVHRTLMEYFASLKTK